MRGKLPDPARLGLSDGTVFRGHAFGARGVGAGEVVFNTSIAGYQEILSDPSYAGQIVVMTYTQIGNVGTNPEDDEAIRPFLRGFVVKEVFEPSNWRSREGLDAYMKRHGVPGISGIDTRALVRRIRDGGAQVGLLSTDPEQTKPSCWRARNRSPASMAATSSQTSPAASPTRGPKVSGRVCLDRCPARLGRAPPIGWLRTTLA